MKEVNLKEEAVFYNILKRIYVAAKKGYTNSKEILAVPVIKNAGNNKWFTVGSRLTPYRSQDLFPVDADQVGNAA